VEFAINSVPANSRADPLTYDGAVNEGSLASFGIAQMESFVRIVTESNYDSFVAEDFDKTKAILFTTKKSTPPLLRALSKDFKGRVVFGEIRESNADLIKKFGITSFPTIMVLGDARNYAGVKYEGEFKKDQIAKFLREHSLPITTKKQRGSAVLRELRPTMIKSGVCSHTDANLCLLALLNSHNNEQNEKVKNVLSELAPKYADDPISFFFAPSINVEYSTSFDDINDFPAILVLKSKKQRYTRYSGELTPEGIQTFVETVISGSATFKKMKDELVMSSQRYQDEL